MEPYVIFDLVRCEGGSKEQLLGISNAPCEDFEGKMLSEDIAYTWRQVLCGHQDACTIQIPLDLPPYQATALKKAHLLQPEIAALEAENRS